MSHDTPSDRDACSHDRLQFGSGDYYVFCLDCMATWMRRGRFIEYGLLADGTPVGADSSVANKPGEPGRFQGVRSLSRRAGAVPFAGLPEKYQPYAGLPERYHPTTIAIAATPAGAPPREPTGKMWSEGRRAFVNQADKFHSAASSQVAASYADVSPAIIWREMYDAWIADAAPQAPQETPQQSEMGWRAIVAKWRADYDALAIQLRQQQGVRQAATDAAHALGNLIRYDLLKPDGFAEAQAAKERLEIALNAAPAPEPVGGGVPSIRRFTAYRRNISQRDTHNALQKNADDEAQFEGVIWTDGTVTLRWLTACKSTSVWASLADCLNIHGHPEYGTEIVWHDGDTPPEWSAALSKARE